MNETKDMRRTFTSQVIKPPIRNFYLLINLSQQKRSILYFIIDYKNVLSVLGTEGSRKKKRIP